LCFGKLERQDGRDAQLHRLIDSDRRTLSLFDALAPLKEEAQCQPEKILEDETLVGGTARPLVLIQWHIFGREVNLAQSR
jgi:hypothetical protein